MALPCGPPSGIGGCGSWADRLAGVVGLVFLVLSAGCVAPVGADRKAPAIVYRQTHENAVSRAQPGRDTRSVLHRFDQVDRFANSPDATLELIHQKAVQSGERGLTFALSELSYLAGERLRRSVKPWEPRDARDYYLASAVYAWCFLFGEAKEPPPDPFDQRFHTACALYNYGLGWALAGRRSTNAEIALAGGTRRLPVGQIELSFSPDTFPWPLDRFDRFVLADQLRVRGLSVRNRQPGLGAPLVAVMKRDEKIGLARTASASVLLRFHGGLADLAPGRCRGSLELYSGFDAATIRVGDRSVPLETDTTAALAYGLNQSFVWKLGMQQFLSAEERIPTDIYLTQPYRVGRVPVVFVHGTFSSPIWWSEMVNTLAGDPELRTRCQFWQFIYNSGNPTADSAVRLREALAAKLRELDPGGQDPALRQMVVIGHSQGGLLTRLTATDTGDRLWQTLLKTNRLDGFGLTANQEALLRRYTCYQALPFVTRVVFISTPHRGSYLAGSFVRRLARKVVSLPSRLVNLSKEFAGLTEKLDLPRELRGMPTSLDSMSPKNPGLLALAEIPLAPGVQGHSIIAVKGQGDYHQGKDGLVTYASAHLEGVESEFIVRSGHSCQDKPPTIEEVRRILRRHLDALPALGTNR